MNIILNTGANNLRTVCLGQLQLQNTYLPMSPGKYSFTEIQDVAEFSLQALSLNPVYLRETVFKIKVLLFHKIWKTTNSVVDLLVTLKVIYTFL